METAKGEPKRGMFRLLINGKGFLCPANRGCVCLGCPCSSATRGPSGAFVPLSVLSHRQFVHCLWPNGPSALHYPSARRHCGTFAALVWVLPSVRYAVGLASALAVFASGFAIVTRVAAQEVLTEARDPLHCSSRRPDGNQEVCRQGLVEWSLKPQDLAGWSQWQWFKLYCVISKRAHVFVWPQLQGYWKGMTVTVMSFFFFFSFAAQAASWSLRASDR